MATTYKVLGQTAPTDTANTDLYTVPADTSAVASTLQIANVTGVAVTFRVFVRIAGASPTDGNAIAYDAPLAANSFASITTGMTLSATDVVSVQTSIADSLTFTLFGSELS